MGFIIKLGTEYSVWSAEFKDDREHCGKFNHLADLAITIHKAYWDWDPGMLWHASPAAMKFSDSKRKSCFDSDCLGV